jgi:thioredoxin 1
MIVECNSNQFDELVLKSEKPVLVDFWAPWCGPCRAIAPVLESFAQKNGDVSVVKINVDENSQLSQKYGIRSIPTLVLFEKGNVSKKATGLQNEETLKKFVN